MFDVTRTTENCFCYFAISNAGKVSAANVILWVTLPEGVFIQESTDWTKDDDRRLRWEARAGLVVHPKVPAYRLRRVQLVAYDPSIQVHYTLVADGIPAQSDNVSVPAADPAKVVLRNAVPP